MLRKVIEIDESLCNGCGDCVSSCAEGAIQLIDGKARLVNEIFCDGLGACVGDCPVNAISVMEKDTEAYDERATMRNLIPKGEKTILAHLKHLHDHGMSTFVLQGLEVLKENDIKVQWPPVKEESGCPSCKTMSFPEKDSVEESADAEIAPIVKLRQWPIQLHLVSPYAPYFENAEVLLAADCVPLAVSNFHTTLLGNKAFAIACPKLDSNKEAYLNKLATMIAETNVKSITVAVMEVPCCSGLVQLAKQAIAISGVAIPLHVKICKISGEVMDVA